MVSYALSTIELVDIGTLTPGSAVSLRQKQYWGRGSYQDDIHEYFEHVLHSVYTVIYIQMQVCVSECTSLIRNLENMGQKSSCRNAASLAAVCVIATCIIEEEASVGVFEESRRFARHVNLVP